MPSLTDNKSNAKSSREAAKNYGSTQDAEACACTGTGPGPRRRNGFATPVAGSATDKPVVVYDVIHKMDYTAKCPVSYQRSPTRLVASDFLFLLRHLYQVGNIFLPFMPSRDAGFVSVIVQVTMLLVSLGLTGFTLFSAVTGMPPLWIPVALTLGWVVLCEQLQRGSKGQRNVRQSKPPNDPEYRDAENAEFEKWFVVNGICTTGSGSQALADRLHELFHRPVTAILNRSLGFWFDVLESLVQRGLRWITEDVRVGYAEIRKAVLDDNIKRVVIFGHSQGGIIVSAWADQLLIDFPHHELAKVELYTFASAANHFSRPTRGTALSQPPFGNVEHFANALDPVAELGVLQVTKQNRIASGVMLRDPEEENGDLLVSRENPDIAISSPVTVRSGAHEVPPHASGPHECSGEVPTSNGQWGGRVFLRLGHMGHLLLAHYLHPADNILDDPVVRQFSLLNAYRDGGNVLPLSEGEDPAQSSGNDSAYKT